jgi:hypothetical protein
MGELHAELSVERRFVEVGEANAVIFVLMVTYDATAGAAADRRRACAGAGVLYRYRVSRSLLSWPR